MGNGAVGKGYLGYCVKNEINLDLMGDRETYKVFWIDPDKGTVIKEDGSVRGGGKVILKAPAESSICFYNCDCKAFVKLLVE